MKRMLAWMLAAVLSFSVFGNALPVNAEAAGGEELQEVSCEEQRFSTNCPEDCIVVWDEEDGMYIYTGGYEGIPYVLIYRYEEPEVDNETMLEDIIQPHLIEMYGSDMIDVSDMEEYTFGDKTLPGIDFTYMVGKYTVHALRLCEQADGDVINYTAKYLDGSGEETLEILDGVIQNMKLTDEEEKPEEKIVSGLDMLHGLSEAGLHEVPLPEVPEKGAEKSVPEGYREVVSEAQGFSTICLEDYESEWVDRDGLYIYTGNPGGIPYVLVYRYEDIPIDSGQFLEESVYTQMVEAYGDKLTIGPQEEYEFGDKVLQGILFTYPVGDYTVHSLRLCEQCGDDIINYTAKYLDGMGDETMDALTDAVNYFSLTGEKPAAAGSRSEDKEPVPEEHQIEIIPSEASQVQYVEYKDPTGCFTMEIPKGWKVETGLPPTGEIDLISYAIRLYDPRNPDRQAYFNLNCTAGLKSREAKEWYIYYYGTNNPFAQLPVLPSVDAKGFFTVLGDIYGYSDFSIGQKLNGFGGAEVLTADCISNNTGEKLSGVFTVMLSDFPYFVQKDMFDYSKGQIDAGFVSAFGVVFETAPSGEWLDWQPVLEHCLSTVSFTKSFQSQRQQLWRQIMGTTQYIAQTGNEISGMIMDSWEKRNTSDDVLSQKRSDATLGYERVYDTELGEYYKAENGFSDWYDGERYVPDDSDTAYLSPVSGYINWK